jgi:guanylate kinase
MSNRFVILSGPSCVGKGPLFHALKTFYPELANRLIPIVLYNSRDPRPGEEEGVAYYFRSKAEIEKLGNQSGYILANVRGDLQALELASIERILASGQDAFFEGNPFIPNKLREANALDNIPTLSAFLSPLSREEVLFLSDPVQRADLGKTLTDIQRRKLLRRTTRQKTILSLKDLENIEQRASSAIVELREAWKFDYVIPCHDGEGNDNWDAFYYPVADARKALLAFASLLHGDETPVNVEKWEKELVK